MLRRLPCLIQLQHLFFGQAEILGKHNHQRQKNHCTSAQSRKDPFSSQLGDCLVQNSVGYKDQKIPLGVRKTGTIQMPAFSLNHKLRAKIPLFIHSCPEILQIFLCRLSVDLLIAVPYPLEIALVLHIIWPDNKASVPTDDKIIFHRGFCIQK